MLLQDNVFVNFGSVLHVMKIVASIVLLVHMFSGYEYFNAVLKRSLPSPNGKLAYSRTIPSMLV